jgi:hypothetical protein
MSEPSKLPPIIEPWRVLLMMLAVVAVMAFAHSITPTQAGAMGGPGVLQSSRIP